MIELHPSHRQEIAYHSKDRVLHGHTDRFAQQGFGLHSVAASRVTALVVMGDTWLISASLDQSLRSWNLADEEDVHVHLSMP